MKQRILASVAISIILLIGKVSGQTVITEPGIEITGSGMYVLENDLLNCSADGVIISANNVIFDGQGYQIDGSNTSSGIRITGNNVTVKNCQIKDFHRGIYLQGANNGNIYSNIIRSGLANGIELVSSSNNDIYSNTVTNMLSGVCLYLSDINDIYSNALSNNIYGMYIQDSDSNQVSSNIGSDNIQGIVLVDGSTGNYGYENSITSNNGDEGCSINGNHIENLSSGYELETGLVPKYSLRQNYPNPFNPTTTISYNLPQPCNVRLTIFDIQGREVIQLVNEHQTPGNYQIEFDASHLPSGIYFYHLKTEKFSKVMKMILQK